MDQRIIALYDRYTHGGMNRRDFLDRLTELAGSAAAAAVLLPLLQYDYARAATIAPDDPRLTTEKASYDAPGGKMSGYLARPKEGGKRPAILVVHENRGLNPHSEDVARRLALEGFMVLAVDLLSPAGGTPPDEDKARSMIAALNTEETVQNLAAGASFLQRHPNSTGKVGAVGFCWGGSRTNLLATASSELAAVVVYYGDVPPAERVSAIRVPLLLHYAGLDNRVNAGIPGYEAALKANGKRYRIHIYPNVNHAFNNDTWSARYDKAASDLAWERTLAFFKEHLGARD